MKNTKKISLNFAILASLIAVGLHFYLTQKYFALKFGSVSEVSACNINQIFNCDNVSASHFSALLGIPMALWGAVTNTFLLLFLLITRFELTDYPEQTSRYTAWLGLFVAFVSVVMGFISLSMLKSVCLFCFFCYFLSFISAFGAWKGSSGSLFSHLKSDFKHMLAEQKWVAFMILAIPAFTFFANALTLQEIGVQNIDILAQEKINQWKSSPEQKFNLETGLILQTQGQEAKMTIVEFADFRCPHCKHAYPTLHAYTQAHANVKLIFKFFPLDGSCNPDPGMKGGGDGISCQMAFLTYCAESLAKKGWDAHHYFFDQQEKMREYGQIDKLTEKFCGDLGLDCPQIKSCANSPTTLEAIRATSMEGMAAQITGTPSIFVNGKLLVGGQLMPILDEARKAIETNH